MNLKELLSDPVRELEIELGQIDEQMQTAAKRGNAGALTKLVERKKQLPELIRQAQLNDIGDKINDQRTRLGVYEMDLKEARELSQTLTSELTPKVTALNQEIERLRNEAQQAIANANGLQFQVGQETREFNRLKKQRENLLLSQLNN